MMEARQWLRADATEEMRGIDIAITPAIVRDAAATAGLDPDQVRLSPLLQLRDAPVDHAGWALTVDAVGRGDAQRIAESLGAALAVHLLQRVGAPLHAPRRGLTRLQWRTVIDHIGDNIASDLSLAELAAVAGVASTTFKALFRESAGMPVHQYVVLRRVEHAVRLIARTTSKLNAIAALAGFVDQSHMARCFRRVLGVTPAAVARQSR